MNILKLKNMRPSNSSTHRYVLMAMFINILILTVVLLYTMYNKPKLDFPKKNNNVKYILDWKFSSYHRYIPHYGFKTFVKRNCSFQNCYITLNRSYFFLGDYSKFDAILFNAVYFMKPDHFPHGRTQNQVYIFGTNEPSAYFPVLSYNFSKFYNWTWTYRLDSDIVFNYMTIRDKNNNIIGPRNNMKWIDSKIVQNTELSDDVRDKLQKKSKTAAWLVTRCESLSKRENYVNMLIKELNAYNKTVDVHGKCGVIPCGFTKTQECMAEMGKEYYFYLSFENSFCEDYATEKVLNPLMHNMIPVVYGGADYSKFVAEGMYLDARKLSPQELAKKMNDIIHNKQLHYSYFKWRNFYSYHAPHTRPDSDTFCRLCQSLNLGLRKAPKTVRNHDKYTNYESSLYMRNNNLSCKYDKTLKKDNKILSKRSCEEDLRRIGVYSKNHTTKNEYSYSSKYNESIDSEKDENLIRKCIDKLSRKEYETLKSNYNENINKSDDDVLSSWNNEDLGNKCDFSSSREVIRNIRNEEDLVRIWVDEEGRKRWVYTDFAAWWNRHEHSVAVQNMKNIIHTD